MGIAGTLTVVFVVLRLTGFIDWSVFWLLSPIIFEMAARFVISICASISHLDKMK